MTTKKDLIQDAIIEAVKLYDPEVIEDKEFIWLLEDLVDRIEEFEQEWAKYLDSEQDKWK